MTVALYLYFWVVKQDPGTERAQEVASWIKEGANAYLLKLYRSLGILSLIIGAIIAVVFSIQPETAGGGAVTMIWKKAWSWHLPLLVGRFVRVLLGLWVCA